MGLAARVTGVTVAFALIAGGGYVVADMYDVVPGFVTLAPRPEPPAPFPSAPGAIEPGEPTSDVEPLPVDAPIPGGKKFSKPLADFTRSKKELGKRTSVVVADAKTGTVLLDKDGSVARTPASTLKLMVGVAALAGPGPDTTLDTRVVQGQGSEIYLVGGGDMMLGVGEGNPAYVNGRAGLGDLADQVVAALHGTGRTEVSLRVDETLFEGPRVPGAVDDINVSLGYLAPLSALAVNIGIENENDPRAPRQREPGLEAGRSFAAELKARGIKVKGSPDYGTAPESGTELAVVSSAPLSQIVDFVLQTSDNTIAEVLGRLVAIDSGLPGSADSARAAVLQTITGLGVNTRGVRLADSSGLGDGSKIPATTLVELLQVMVDPEQPGLRDGAIGMPIAGLTGTLYDRFLTSDARGLVRAKTGSLPDVRSLAGTVVTADGRLVVFAIMLESIPDGHAWDARVHIDRLVSSIAECGC